jgi:hypothetical protein
MRKAIALSILLLSSWACSSSSPATSSCGDFQVADPTTGNCVQCVTDPDCAGALEGPVCLASESCGCSAAADCASSSRGAACLTTSVCGCNADADCGDATPTCDTSTNLCTTP